MIVQSILKLYYFYAKYNAGRQERRMVVGRWWCYNARFTYITCIVCARRFDVYYICFVLVYSFLLYAQHILIMCGRYVRPTGTLLLLLLFSLFIHLFFCVVFFVVVVVVLFVSSIMRWIGWTWTFGMVKERRRVEKKKRVPGRYEYALTVSEMRYIVCRYCIWMGTEVMAEFSWISRKYLMRDIGRKGWVVLLLLLLSLVSVFGVHILCFLFRCLADAFNAAQRKHA